MDPDEEESFGAAMAIGSETTEAEKEYEKVINLFIIILFCCSIVYNCLSTQRYKQYRHLHQFVKHNLLNVIINLLCLLSVKHLSSFTIPSLFIDYGGGNLLWAS